MQSKILNPRDIEFILYELLDIESVSGAGDRRQDRHGEICATQPQG
jgi:hypothetical protein